MSRAAVCLLVLLCLLSATGCGESEGEEARSQNDRLEDELQTYLSPNFEERPLVDCVRPRPEHHLCTVYVRVSNTGALVGDYAVYDCEVNWRARLRSSADDLHLPTRIEGEREADAICP